MTVVEPLTYEKLNGFSYLQDLATVALGREDEAARERLRRHAIDVEDNPEIRRLADVKIRGGGSTVPPLYLLKQLGGYGSRYADLLPLQVLPPYTDSISMPPVVTGVVELDVADEAIMANVVTTFGQQGVLIDLLDQSPIAFDELVFRDVAQDLAHKITTQVSRGTGVKNQVTGIGSTPGIGRMSVPALGPELHRVRSLYYSIGEAVKVSSRSGSKPVITMTDEAWDSLVGEGGSLGSPATECFLSNVGAGPKRMHGCRVHTDADLVPGSVVRTFRAEEMALFLSPPRARALPETCDKGKKPKTVLLQLYSYMAFAVRNPSGVVEITIP